MVSIQTNSLFIFFPVVQDILDLFRFSQVVNILEVFLGKFKWLGSQVWNILTNQVLWFNRSLWDLLAQESLEWLNTRHQVGRVEWNRNTLQWDNSKTSF